MAQLKSSTQTKIDVVQSNVDAIVANITWHTLTFQNGWSDYGGGAKVLYGKDGTGTVWVKGVVAGGTDAAISFNLPVGFRPATQLNLATSTSTGIGQIVVSSNGDVTLIQSSPVWTSVCMSFKGEL